MTRRSCLLAAFALLALCSCGGGGSSSGPPPEVPAAEVKLLFMGNSHTITNGVPDMVAAMVRAARPDRNVAAVLAPGSMFLGERANDAATLALLRGNAWSFVVLQAQEYSSSGAFTYPTDGAEALVRMASEGHAVPILFPEWARVGVDESRRIFALHVSIAMKQPACVAPIPQAFDLALARHPDITLHAADGNHSSPAGAFLAALVIANTMTGFAPDRLPFLPQLASAASESVQERLRIVAAETVATYPPRQWCPGMP